MLYFTLSWCRHLTKASLGVKRADVVHQSGTALRVAVWEPLLFLLKAVDFLSVTDLFSTATMQCVSAWK